jgi:phytanoyl-CoA hydroxylase
MAKTKGFLGFEFGFAAVFLAWSSSGGVGPSSGIFPAVTAAATSSGSGGVNANSQIATTTTTTKTIKFGRISDDEFILTPDQIDTFHRDGCITIPDVLSSDEVDALTNVFDRFVSGDIEVPGKDFCDMSKPFGIPFEEWSLVNCMLPTRYYPKLQNNVYERLCRSMARQLFPTSDMTKDYDQLLNKRPGKTDAMFAWHQDMAYWPSKEVLGVDKTDTCTFSLAMDKSDIDNGCLRYVVGSGTDKSLRPHRPAMGETRDDGHALACEAIEGVDEIKLAPANKGSITIHDEWVVHGSSGNKSYRQRRTYVVAFRDQSIVDAERRIGFTHSHNDEVNWDTFVCSKEEKADKE